MSEIMLRAMEKLQRERDELRDAVRAYRDAKGRYHTQKACERLLALLPENVQGHAAAGETPEPVK